VGLSRGETIRTCPYCGAYVEFLLFEGIAAADGADPLNPLTAAVLVAEPARKKTRRKQRFYYPLWCRSCGGVVVVEVANTYSKEAQTISVVHGGESTSSAQIAGLPTRLSEAYREAMDVFGTGNVHAAAVALRTVLEGAAIERGVERNTPLVKMIRQLYENRLVSEEITQALDVIRKIGNVGAHYGDDNDVTISSEDVARAMRFTTVLLQMLFEIPHELSNLTASDGDDTEDAGT
jgi:hypothetical protein